MTVVDHGAPAGDGSLTRSPPGALVARAGWLLAALAFWLTWFAVTRLLFFAWQRPLSAPLSAELFGGAFLHGARMDLATAACLTLVPWLLLVLLIAKPSLQRRALRAYVIFAVILVSVLTVGDLQLYSAWRVRLDATPLQFLRSPREMIASTASAPILLLSVVLAVLVTATLSSADRLLLRSLDRLPRGGIGTALGLVAAGTTLLIPIRGGLQWTPLNQSSVYFSNDDFANQAALNPGWTFVHGLLSASSAPTRNPYRSMPPAEATALADSLYQARPPSPRLLRIDRPNIILIVWESLTGKVVERLGGAPGITPGLERLSHEGIFFDSVFASADRSAQGLVALLSAFPALPHQQIMNTPEKAARLPILSRDLADAGYRTSFYYGGELEFANMKAYVLAGRFGRIVGEEAFPTAQRNSKWGAHDHVVLSRLAADLPREPRPFFSTLVTLSSHEPFEVPVPAVFPATDQESLFLNAHHYTDRSVAAFIDDAKRQPWWDSTLVVIVADHGHILPAPLPGRIESIPDRYRVPMLWLGGALAVHDTVVHVIGSQVDLGPTLLGQLRIAAPGYRWGRDLFAAGGGFAFFSYRDGFAMIEPEGRIVVDVAGRRTLEASGEGAERARRHGAALLQATFEDFLAR